MKEKMSKLEWFGNDADGLSMIDFITVFMFVYFLAIKTIHFYVAIKYSHSPTTMKNTTIVMSEINKFTDMIIMFYFGKKTIDTTITKIGLFKSNQYENRNTISVPIASDVIHREDINELSATIEKDKLENKTEILSVPIETLEENAITNFDDSITKEMVTIEAENIEEPDRVIPNNTINDITKPEIDECIHVEENILNDNESEPMEVADIDKV